MNLFFKILQQVINGFFVPKPPKKPNIDEIFASNQILLGLPMVTKLEHVNSFLRVIGLKITKHCIGTKIFPSMAIAQAALESGWNTTAKTLYGIKAIGWAGKTVDTRTREERGGISYYVSDSFRSYDNIDSCIKDYIKVLHTAPWFKDVIDSETVADAVHALQSDKTEKYKNKKYATDGKYESKIMSIINEFDLRKYDELKYRVERCLSN